MKNLFAYGTLMCDEIMEEVAGCRLSYKAGTLRGYSRRAVRGEHYPAIFREEKGLIQGLVYLGVPDRAWQRLDRFEGEMYVRQTVQIQLANGMMLFANTYVVQPAFLDALEEVDWDFESFLRHGKESFQKYYKGYQSMEASDPPHTQIRQR
jgi:gamma-glutamylcyclotransferase (GGCT)/AIG2-like uncharacterized protein YtfP